MVAAPGGSILHLWVVPGASRPGVVGPHGDALRVRVTAPPIAGAANRQVVELVAAGLGLRQAAVRLVSGAGGRRKRVFVQGLGPEDVRTRLTSQGSVDTPRRRH